MTSTMQKNRRPPQAESGNNGGSVRLPGKLKAAPTQRRYGAALHPPAKPAAVSDQSEIDTQLRMRSSQAHGGDAQVKRTAIEQCVQSELRRYFDMLDGEEPANLYRMVIKQAESALVSMVMEECRGNQTRASEWLGISRGNLRTKLASMDK